MTYRSRVLAVGAAAALVATTSGLTSAGALNQTKLALSRNLTGSTTAAPTKPLSSRLAQSDPAVLHLSGSAMTPVMVKLDYDALSSYTGDVPGLAATSPQITGHKIDPASPEARAYSGHIGSVEGSFVAALRKSVPAAVVARAYHTVYGGLALRVPADRVASLLALPGAIAVQQDTLQHLDAATPVADDDAEFIGANAAYSALGSSATAGKGVIVADVDTGVWPEHPSFAARPDLPPAPSTPACNFGTNPLTGVAFVCNNKLIGGQVFLATYNALIGDEKYPSSARDSAGHGTHTTSTAAGNPLDHASLFGVDRGPVQGIAPGAFVLSYKALGPQGGFSSDLVAAIEQAIVDGADVINYSIGPGSPQSAYTSPDDLAFLDAFNAGVFASTSAGNSGPGAGSVAHLGPWETTVGASSLQRAFVATATLSASGASPLALQGNSIMPGITSPAPVVNATSLAGYDAGCSKAAAAGSFTGKIVVCVRGGIGRIQKGFNVLAGGAVGMFLINPVVEDTETDNHFLPAIHFDQPAGAQLESYLAAHPGGVTATSTAGAEGDGQGDVMAAFSSRGPGGDFLKPDITAPGIQILAGDTPTPTAVADGAPNQLFQAIAGTSMSAPHITGSAALVFALHPTWSPAQVKSALMTTAERNVVNQDGITPAGVFDDGAGRVALAGIVDPGLTLNVNKKQMDAVLTDPIHRIDLNEPSVYDAALPGRVTTSRTFKNVDKQAATYAVGATSTLSGGITVTPSTFTVDAGKTQAITIALDGTSGTPGTIYSGMIDLQQTNGSHHLHLPVAFSPSSPSSGLVTLSTGCDVTVIHLSHPQDTACTVTAHNNALQPARVDLSTTWTDNLSFVGASGGAVKTGPDSVTLPTTRLKATQPAVPQIAPGTSPGGFVDLAGFGATLQKMGDETISNLTNLKPFQYAGQTYTSVGVVSDGYLVVGGGTAADINSNPQHFPDPVRPNNVLAPLWTDLDGGNGTIAGQGFYAVVLTDNTTHQSWNVIQWNTHVFGVLSHLETFQVWLGANGTEDVSFTYDPAHPVTDPGLPFNIGAENLDGTGGSNFTGLPAPGTDLVVHSTPAAPGGTVTYTVLLHGKSTLPGNAPSKVETDMTTTLTRDTSVSINTVQVLP
jgi:subtilisin family serine protease